MHKSNWLCTRGTSTHTHSLCVLAGSEMYDPEDVSALYVSRAQDLGREGKYNEAER